MYDRSRFDLQDCQHNFLPISIRDGMYSMGFLNIKYNMYRVAGIYSLKSDFECIRVEREIRIPDSPVTLHIHGHLRVPYVKASADMIVLCRVLKFSTPKDSN